MKQCALREREKIKALGLVGPIGKCLYTLMVHLDLVGMWVVLIVTSLVDSWSFILLGPNTLIVCVPLL